MKVFLQTSDGKKNYSQPSIVEVLNWQHAVTKAKELAEETQNEVRLTEPAQNVSDFEDNPDFLRRYCDKLGGHYFRPALKL